jgi:MOSC domain-containing protein YiiM
VITDARLVTICVARPKLVLFEGRTVQTAIFKTPVTGKIELKKLNLAGDKQADLTVHGGPDKAVYSYPLEHYEWWQEQLPGVEFEHGKFGENFTTTGLLEEDVYIGDEFSVGSAVIKAAQPRIPCYKLAVKFKRSDIIKRFLKSGRSGIYFSVVEEGELSPGDEIKFLRSDGLGIGVHAIADLFTGRSPLDTDLIERALDSQLADQMKMFIKGLRISHDSSP